MNNRNIEDAPLFRIYRKKKGYGYVDKTGKEGKKITSCKYDLVLDCSEGLAWVRLDWKDGYIDRAGCEIMPFGDFKNYNLGEFHDGMARVEMGGKYGYLKG